MSLRLTIVFAALLAPTSALVVAPCAACTPMTRCATPLATAVGSTPVPRLRKVLGMPVNVVRGVWHRCTPDLCEVGRPRPLEILKSLIPRKRPLARLVHTECSEGTYKVERLGGKRQMKLFPVKPARQECSTEDAMDMF